MGKIACIIKRTRLGKNSPRKVSIEITYAEGAANKTNLNSK